MSVCLDYQAVYKRKVFALSFRAQLLSALFLLLVLAFKVWVRIECTNLGYVVAKEKQETMDLDMERRELELRLSVLNRADTLAKKAHSKLGLMPLDPKQARKMIY